MGDGSRSRFESCRGRIERPALSVAVWVSTQITTSTISDGLSMSCPSARRDVVGSGPDGDGPGCDGTRHRDIQSHSSSLSRQTGSIGRGRRTRTDRVRTKAGSQSNLATTWRGSRTRRTNRPSAIDVATPSRFDAYAAPLLQLRPCHGRESMRTGLREPQIQLP